MRISILCPTRGRPESCAEMLRTIKQSVSNPHNVRVLLYVDDDDPCVDRYVPLHDPGNVEVVIGAPVGVGHAWNELAKLTDADLLWMGNDDLRYEQHGFDRILINAVGDMKYACLWGDDGINGENHCAFPAITRQWHKQLGYFTPVCFRFFYHDTWIFDVAKRIGRAVYVPDLKISHRHHTVDGGVRDATTLRNRTDGQAEEDKATWDRTEYARAESAKLLMEMMGR